MTFLHVINLDLSLFVYPVSQLQLLGSPMSFARSIRLPLIATSIALMSTACASSSQHNFGIGTGVSTTGVNVEAKYAASNNLVLRGSVSALPITTDQNYDGVDYEASIDMLNVGAFADIYPFKNNGFNISGGVYAGDKSLDLLGTPDAAQMVEIGNQTYTGAEIGTLTGSVEYSNVAPFVGIGYDGFLNHNRLWSLSARAGVMLIGSPEVNVIAEGGLVSAQPAVQDELEREAQNLQDELDEYKYYPVVSLGITRRF